MGGNLRAFRLIGVGGPPYLGAMESEVPVTAETVLLLGDRVFGTIAPGPEMKPAWYVLGGWHHASRRWVVFKEDHQPHLGASLGISLATERLAALGFIKGGAGTAPATPVYIIVSHGSEERSIEVPSGTDPMHYPGLEQGFRAC